MEGGKIIVNGNVINIYSNGGEVEVFGDVKKIIIPNKSTIKLHGNYQLYNPKYYTLFKTFNLYHKGKQIIKDGKPVDGAEIKWAKSY